MAKRQDDDPSGGLYSEYTEEGNGVFRPTQRPNDANYGNTFGKQLTAANNYRQNLGKTSDSIYDTYANQARYGLADSMKQVNDTYSSRGLLGSGLQAKSQAQTRGAAASDLAGKRSEINQGLLGNLNQLEGNAFNTANTMANSQGPDTASPYMNYVKGSMDRQNDQAQQSADLYGGIAQGVGGLAGYGLANSMYNQNPMNNVTQYGPWAGGYGNGSMGQGYYK